ncbi:MAG TPA: polyprenyl synthetase family protein [Abditibacteriaceae bacterium]|jgi:geranylgeranyl pyrophosphate synthase
MIEVNAENENQTRAPETIGAGDDTGAARGVMPDVLGVVQEATDVAAARNGNLHPAAMTGQSPQSTTENTQNSPAEEKRGSVPVAAPWNQVSDELFAGARQVDIMKSLRRIEPQMQAMEREIDQLITTPVKLIADLAAHTLGAGGKRLRPALVILAAQLCGDSPTEANRRVTTCAAAMELIHTTSLIHDDVVDSATVRRGKPAANLVWGNGTSVLVGDYLFAQVFVTVSANGFHDLLQPIAHATSQLCAGELLETQTRGLLSMKEKQYCDIIALKTAALTECSCRLGAMALGATEDHVQRLAHFGRDIGMAFQIVDDIFDIVATESGLGKPVGNDIREGDVTLPMLRAAAVCSEAERLELASLIGKDPIGDEDVQRALEIIRSTDAVSHCYSVAADYIASAKAQLDVFPDSEARSMLYDIADYVGTRDK